MAVAFDIPPAIVAHLVEPIDYRGAIAARLAAFGIRALIYSARCEAGEMQMQGRLRTPWRPVTPEDGDWSQTVASLLCLPRGANRVR